MEFPKTYFDEEVKAGYYVDSAMKCCWAAQLEVLAQIDRICRKHHIEYFAEWGTLLGTVRHGGYIPWDDDMDISMKRKDYEKFLKVAPSELPEGYTVLNCLNQEDYWDVMSRVVNSADVDFTSDFMTSFHDMPYIMGVDIFPLDYAPRDKTLTRTQQDLIQYVKSVADVNGNEGMEDAELERHLSRVEELTARKIDRTKSIKDQLYTIVNGLYALYTEAESDEIALMALYLEKGGHIYPKEYYADSVRMPYENMTIPVPIGYDSILKKKYRDYMQNIRKGGTHDYPYYEKMQAFVEEKGAEIPRYKYPAMPLAPKQPGFKEALAGRLELLEKVHEKLEMLLQYGEMPTALTLLEQCQELAVGVGGSIEKKAGEGTQAVTDLEQYCEAVFQIHSALSEGNRLDGAGVKALLDEVLGQVADSIVQLPLKKEIVFMPIKASRWTSFESVWREAINDPDNDVKVVPLPYFYKQAFTGTIKSMEYEAESFPEKLHVVSCDEYDFKNNHPDIIYIQEPYDEWQYIYSVHPDYYTPKLRENCGELIYIPWFKTDEMEPEDERGLKSRNYYVPMPGLVYADKVILQSEGMKESYVEYLSKWAGEETRSIWEQKLFGTGHPLDALEPERENKPSEWGDKKVILYHVSGNSLMEYKQDILEKIKNSMAVFEEQQPHIQVVWLQDAMVQERFGSRIPRLLKEYNRLVEKYEGKDWVTVRSFEEAEELYPLADGYYGDASRLAQGMRQAKKPVMIQNIEIRN